MILFHIFASHNDLLHWASLKYQYRQFELYLPEETIERKIRINDMNLKKEFCFKNNFNQKILLLHYKCENKKNKVLYFIYK